MSARIPWTRRAFNFDFPWELYPEQTERLRGTPARARALIEALPQAYLVRRDGSRWSIQENIAHLADMDEFLWWPRIREFEAGLATLRAADMTNAVTNAARHNERSIIAVMDRFAAVRHELVRHVESLPHDLFARVAQHPRLNKPMRLTDHLFFVAEHDDYHLAHITGLRRQFGCT